MSDWPEPEIDYPCAWSYKLVGPDEQAIRIAVAEVVGDRVHQVALSRASRGGKYVSLKLELSVTSHDDRRGLATVFKDHPAVLFVL